MEPDVSRLEGLRASTMEEWPVEAMSASKVELLKGNSALEACEGSMASFLRQET